MANIAKVMALLLLSVNVRMILSMSCKNKDGSDVAWYYVVKVPIIPGHENGLIKNGVGFYYLDENNPSFELSETGVESKTSNPIEKTLNQIYQLAPSEKASYVMYNDHPPSENNACNCRGHAKGVAAHDNGKGFWMIHSIPRFPNIRTFEWPSSASKNGQSILCVTFQNDKKEAIQKQLATISPTVYFQKDFDVALAFQHETQHISLDNVFHHFAKSSSFTEDLYSDFVALELEIGLKAETWTPQNINDYCGPSYLVCNVKNLNLSTTVIFPSTKDHSKWAITWRKPVPSENKKYVCVGDLNRVRTPYARGGGTMCANLPAVWEQYNKIVKEVGVCKKGTDKHQKLECYHDVTNENSKTSLRHLFTDLEDFMLSVVPYI